jgi:hypothetical protein
MCSLFKLDGKFLKKKKISKISMIFLLVTLLFVVNKTAIPISILMNAAWK